MGGGDGTTGGKIPGSFFHGDILRVERKLEALRKHKFSLSTMERIWVANTLIVSTLRHTMQFVKAPWGTLSNLNTALEKWVAPVWRGFPLDLLSLPEKVGGLRRPLRNIKALNMAAIEGRVSSREHWSKRAEEQAMGWVDWLPPSGMRRTMKTM